MAETARAGTASRQGRLVQLSEIPPPGGFEARWALAGFDLVLEEEAHSPESIEADLTLLWVDEDWESGLGFLQSASGRPCTCLMVGSSPLPRAIGQRLRALGSLGGLEWPADDVHFIALGNALERSEDNQSYRSLDEFRTLAPPVENSPFLLFGQVARIAHTLLRSDLTLIALQVDEGGLLFLNSGDAGLRPVGWPVETNLRHARLAEEAIADGGILVVPDLRESAAGTDVRSYSSAIAVPLEVSSLQTDFDKSSTVVSLYWEEPFLPTAVEYLSLEVLAALGRAALLCSVNRSRLARAHVQTTKALDELHQTTAIPDLEDSWEELEERTQSGFVRKLLAAYAAAPYLEDLWVYLSPYSRGRPAWLSLRSHAAEPPLAVPEKFLECRGTQIELAAVGELWALLMPVRGERRCFGVLVAIFTNRAGATLVRDEMLRLATDLALGARFFRRSINNAAVVELNKILLNAEPADLTLLRMARVVQRAMAADGCKILVVRSTPAGLGLQQICRTDDQTPQSEPLPLLDLERGLADWVLLHGEWLLIDRPAPGDRTGIDPERGVTRGNREVERLGRSEQEFDITAERVDDEGTILLVPLHREGNRAGVLAVWRESRDPFGIDLDTEALQHFAPHIASACGQALQVETLQDQLAAVSALARHLAGCGSLPLCYAAVLEHVARLARVPHALLMLADADDHFFAAAAWSADGLVELPRALRNFQLHSVEKPKDRATELELALDDVLHANGLGELQCLRLFELHDKESRRPRTYVAFLGPSDPYDEIGIFVEDFQEQAVRSFLSYAGSMLEKHIPDFRHKIVDEFFTELEKDVPQPQQILERATELVLQVTGAEGALSYGGDDKSKRVTATVPERKELLGLEVLPESFTYEAIHEKHLVYFSEMTVAEQPADRRSNLERIHQGFGWRDLRSWLSCPVVHEGRYFGLIKILTSGKGVYLTRDHAELVEAVAHRAAWEIFKVNRHEVLNQLNAMAKELAGTSGTDLGQALIRSLQSFAVRFLREGCKVAVVCRSETDDEPLIQAASSSLSPKVVERFPELSRSWNKRQVDWQANKILPRLGKRAKPLPYAGIAVPLQLTGQSLSGHLFVIHSAPFSRSEINILREAARESAIILNGERLREDWVTLVGMFRHALLGPVQGLMSSAKELADLAEEAGLDPDEIREPRAILEAEAEAIRLWRENQRLYMSKDPEIVPRRESLRDLLETSIERFRVAMAERRIALKEDWPEKGSWIFAFDRAALDLAISNLLDNARKYSFANRIVTLGARSEETNIVIWVEDEGLPIPERLEKKIYDFGKRLDFRDPARAIHGQGLGLPMARRVIEAHGGKLSHTSRRLERKGRGLVPNRVRFTIEIPHHWR